MVRTFSSFLIAFLFATFSAQTKKVDVVRGPYLQVPTSKSMVVKWRTNFMTRSTVFYGENPKSLTQKVDSLHYTLDHAVTLSDLKPDTKYYYKVGIPKDTLEKQIFTFKTFPTERKSQQYSFASFGDPGSLGEDQAKVKKAVLNYFSNNEPDFWLILGDNAYKDGTDEEFQNNFFDPFSDILSSVPVFSTPGNHDYHDVDFGAEYAQSTKNTVYFNIFSNPTLGESGGTPSGTSSYYSFNMDNHHFISLDSYAIEKGNLMLFDENSEQYKWLLKDLEASKNKTGFKIVFTHFPPFSKGTHDSDTGSIETGIREKLLPIFEKYGIDLVLSGHSHVYERSMMLNGFYGKSKDFTDKNKNAISPIKKYHLPDFEAVDYYKKKNNKGIIYIVNGNSSATSKSKYIDFPHRVMQVSNDQLSGACVVEINKNVLTFKWITEDSKIGDAFVIEKR